MKVIIGSRSRRSIAELRKALEGVRQRVTVSGTFQSMAEFRKVQKQNLAADLLLLDTDLEDGNGFEVLRSSYQLSPVIFVSDSGKDALLALKTNAVDFLVRPLRSDALAAAIEKVTRSQIIPGFPAEHETPIPVPSYKKRFLIKTGSKMLFRYPEEVAYFYADGKNVYLVTLADNRKFMVDHSLEDLMRLLDPSIFFRISRKHIVNVRSIIEIRSLANGKLVLKLSHPSDHPFEVTRERSASFKKWLDQ